MRGRFIFGFPSRLGCRGEPFDAVLLLNCCCEGSPLSALRPIPSPVKCDRCDNEATVHEVMISGGKSAERHLCERCAAAAGVQIQQPQPAVTQILSQLIKGVTGPPNPPPATPTPGKPAAATACSSCGLAFAQFRQSGMLGCPHCYAAFEGQLGPLLSRAHEGGTHHVGKVPRSIEAARAAAPTKPAAAQSDPHADERKRATLLRKQLTDAVSAEHYEKAATLRDELHKIEAILRAATAPTGVPGLAPPPRAARKPKDDPGPEGTQS